MKKHKGFIFLILLNLLPLILVFLFFFSLFIHIDFMSWVDYIIVYPYIFYITTKLYIIDTVIMILYCLYSYIRNKDENKRTIFMQETAIIVMIILDFFTYGLYNMLMSV